MASSTPLISIDSLSLNLGGKSILRNISFQADSGEFIGIVGPNGSGKTSLLRALDGLVSVSQGEAVVEGIDLLNASPRRRARKIAFMQQKSAGGVTFPALSVVLTGCYPYSGNRPTSGDIRTARNLLIKYGLSGYEDRLFHTLSTGEQQIVLFCRTLIQNTPLLLLDEPASNLDLGHQELLMEAALEATLSGKTVLMALHDLNRAARFCDRLFVLKQGCMVTEGKPQTLLDAELLQTVWNVRSFVEMDPLSGSPRILPLPQPESSVNQEIGIYSDEPDAFRMTRLLLRRGFPLKGYLVDQQASIGKLWKELGIPSVLLKPDQRKNHPVHDRAFYASLLQ